MRELFIYYQIPAVHADAARGRVEAFQARLRERFPEMATRLLRRPEQPMELQTWMEIYTLAQRAGPHGITNEIETEIQAEARDLDGLLVGTRHVEAFIPCAS